MDSKGKGQDIQSEASKTTNKLSLQHNDQAHIKCSNGMKDGPKAPPTQLPYVPLHAAEFIKLSVCRAVKDPVLWDFPPLACRLNLTMSLNIVHCMAEGVFLITPQTLDPVFFPQQFLFLLSFFPFSFSFFSFFN